MNVGPRLTALALLTLLCQPIAHAGQTDEPVELRVGSKTFTESVILTDTTATVDPPLTGLFTAGTLTELVTVFGDGRDQLVRE